MKPPLFLVIYEGRHILGHHVFKSLPETFDTWELADEAAKVTAAANSKRAWVVQIVRPSLIELVTT